MLRLCLLRLRESLARTCRGGAWRLTDPSLRSRVPWAGDRSGESGLALAQALQTAICQLSGTDPADLLIYLTHGNGHTIPLHSVFSSTT